MSEPMSNVEIEDVLSSIRRLVSQDPRTANKAKHAAPVEVAPSELVGESDSKLMLTPSLRVVPDRLAQADRGVVGAQPPVPATKLPRLHLGIENRRVDLFEPFSAQEYQPGTDFESETGDPYPDVTRMEWTEDGWVLAEMPQSTVEPQDPWAREEYLSGQDEVDLGAFDERQVPEAAAFGQSEEMDGEAVAGLDIPLAAASVESPKEGPVGAEDQEPLEVVFDEQVLRDLVRDILREELQGRMGERMTRNIRKLVHAEIARLVAAQELD